MKWLDKIRSRCGIWHWYQRRKALGTLMHAKFEMVQRGDTAAQALLTEKIFEVMDGCDGACSL